MWFNILRAEMFSGNIHKEILRKYIFVLSIIVRETVDVIHFLTKTRMHLCRIVSTMAGCAHNIPTSVHEWLGKKGSAGNKNTTLLRGHGCVWLPCLYHVRDRILHIRNDTRIFFQTKSCYMIPPLTWNTWHVFFASIGFYLHLSTLSPEYGLLFMSLIYICLWSYISLLQRSRNYGVWNYWQQKHLYCICYTIWIDWNMIFGLEQEGGSLIAPMALAHPLHPIDNRSGNRRRNPWVGWCVSSWWPLFPPRSSVSLC